MPAVCLSFTERMVWALRVSGRVPVPKPILAVCVATVSVEELILRILSPDLFFDVYLTLLIVCVLISSRLSEKLSSHSFNNCGGTRCMHAVSFSLVTQTTARAVPRTPVCPIPFLQACLLSSSHTSVCHIRCGIVAWTPAWTCQRKKKGVFNRFVRLTRNTFTKSWQTRGRENRGNALLKRSFKQLERHA